MAMAKRNLDGSMSWVGILWDIRCCGEGLGEVRELGGEAGAGGGGGGEGGGRVTKGAVLYWTVTACGYSHPSIPSIPIPF